MIHVHVLSSSSYLPEILCNHDLCMWDSTFWDVRGTELLCEYFRGDANFSFQLLRNCYLTL